VTSSETTLITSLYNNIQ